MIFTRNRELYESSSHTSSSVSRVVDVVSIAFISLPFNVVPSVALPLPPQRRRRRRRVASRAERTSNPATVISPRALDPVRARSASSRAVELDLEAVSVVDARFWREINDDADES